MYAKGKLKGWGEFPFEGIGAPLHTSLAILERLVRLMLAAEKVADGAVQVLCSPV